MDKNLLNSLKRLETNLNEVESITSMVNRTISSHDELKSKIQSYISELDTINKTFQSLASDVKEKQGEEATQFEKLIKETMAEAEKSAKSFSLTVDNISKNVDSWKTEIAGETTKLLAEQQRVILGQSEYIINTIQNFSRNQNDKINADTQEISGKVQNINRSIQELSEKFSNTEKNIQELIGEVKSISSSLLNAKSEILEANATFQKKLDDILTEQGKKVSQGLSSIKNTIFLCCFFSALIISGVIFYIHKFS